jgi:hypothetical protein
MEDSNAVHISQCAEEIRQRVDRQLIGGGRTIEVKSDDGAWGRDTEVTFLFHPIGSPTTQACRINRLSNMKLSGVRERHS